MEHTGIIFCMPVYAVIATKNPEAIGRKIEADYPDSSIPIKTDAWFIDCRKTTRELAVSLGIRDGETGSGIVVLLGNYSGRAPEEIWEWLDVHTSEPN